MEKNKNRKTIICVIGLGYVGLQVAIAFSKKYKVIGYDKSIQRINELKKINDKTNEVSFLELKNSNVKFTSDKLKIKKANLYLVAVPTPIHSNKEPDLKALKSASSLISSVLNKNDTVVYESTVYPGCTEEFCIPILESKNKLKYEIDFSVGYSPERIVPGDKSKKFINIPKVVSSNSVQSTEYICDIYKSVVKARIYKASSIKVAEASKIIENTQRDVNIALINEISVIFDKVGISTEEVLKAASTKWNFHSYKPGLVGGHCIGVDPYYLVSKANSLGLYPDLISEARRINDGMSSFIVDKTIKLIIKAQGLKKSINICILGFAFKENCKDIRNTKIINLINEFKSLNINVEVHDPEVDKLEVKKYFNLKIFDLKNLKKYNAVILAVPHKIFVKNYKDMILDLCQINGILIDLKSMLQQKKIKKIRPDINIWSL